MSEVVVVGVTWFNGIRKQWFLATNSIQRLWAQGLWATILASITELLYFLLVSTPSPFYLLSPSPLSSFPSSPYLSSMVGLLTPSSAPNPLHLPPPLPCAWPINAPLRCRWSHRRWCGADNFKHHPPSLLMRPPWGSARFQRIQKLKTRNPGNWQDCFQTANQTIGRRASRP